MPDFVPATLLCGAVVLCCSARLRSNQFLNHAAVWCCVVVPDFVPVTLLCGAVALWCCSARLCFQPRWCVVWCCVVVCGVLLRGTMQADHWVGINQPDKMFPFARAIFDAQGTIQVSPCGGRLTIQLACVLACVLACERCTPPPPVCCVWFSIAREGTMVMTMSSGGAALPTGSFFGAATTTMSPNEVCVWRVLVLVLVLVLVVLACWGGGVVGIGVGVGISHIKGVFHCGG